MGHQGNTAENTSVRPDIFDKAYNFKDADQAREAGIYPYFRVIHSDQDTNVKLNGSDVLMLGSNSYLGLTNHPYVKEQAKKAIDMYGTGCAGSRFLNGTLDIHIQLEERLAELVGKEAALVFATGYQANLGAISALASTRNDLVITDKLDHACIIDGVRMSFGEMVRYNHSDMNHLEKLLQQHKDRPKLIATDGVFSMDGDIAKLNDISYLADKYAAQVFVDEAHSVGVLGKHGGGTVQYLSLEDQTELISGTFSKSLASVGGFVAGDAKVIDYIKHHARSMIFSASLPPGSAGSVLGALDIMHQEPERMQKLWDNTYYMMHHLQEMGFNIGKSETPIVPVIIGDDTTTFQMWKMLQEANIFVNPTVPPAVAKGQSLIRTSYMATHTKDQLDYALMHFKKAGEELGILSA